jgi:hydrogenase nickel incorporation protein HypB
MNIKVDVNEKILSKNDEIAERLRNIFREKKIAVYNFVSSPGSGKTSILEKTLVKLKDKYNIAVIEGDLQTENDAERIRKIGVQAIQITTGGACHLEAASIEKAIQHFDLDNLDILIIENVGNLVCPAAYDLGEDDKIVVISTTEGDDKPAKYPKMIRVSTALIVNKSDLLPYVPFNVNNCIKNALDVQPKLKVFTTSCTKEDGIDDWLNWFEGEIVKKIK